MRYMLLICADEKAEAQIPKAEMDTIVQGHMRFAEELRKAGKMVVGERLRPESNASRIRLKAGQRHVMDGPFAETKEALVFNEGYAAQGGDTLLRHELCEEAIRLGRTLAELMPGEPEVLGLLALMELQASRAAARADFLWKLGRWMEAAVEYRRALELADNARVRRFYAARLAACAGGGELSSMPEGNGN